MKDRKGRTLAWEDTHHYRRVVGALAETIRLMEAIDATIEAHGGWPLQVQTVSKGRELALMA